MTETTQQLFNTEITPDFSSDSVNTQQPVTPLQPEGGLDSVYLSTEQYRWQDSLLQARTEELFPQGIPQQPLPPPGIEGIPLPYMLRSNDWITGIILLCFFSISYVFATGRRLLKQKAQNFFFTREHSSIFGQQTAADIHSRFLLMLQTCMFASILFFDYTVDHSSLRTGDYGIPFLLSGYILTLIIFYLVKWGIYRFVNWIFFDKEKAKLWIETYFFTISTFGIICFPLVLLIVYFDLSPSVTAISCIFILFSVKLLLLYKSFSIFFNSWYGVFYLIMYFCALEILPSLVLWKGLIHINSLLTIKI